MTSSEKQQTFVVATGLNEGGMVAVRTAYGLWRRLEGVELHIVHVVDSSGKDIGKLNAKMDDAMDEMREHVIAAVEGLDLPTDDHIQPVGHIRIGDPAEIVCQLAVDVDADLIVVGAHARRGIGRIVLGSVSDEVARKARTPVMVARAKDFSGVRHTSGILPPRADQDEYSGALTSKLSFIRSRNSHIPGLI